MMRRYEDLRTLGKNCGRFLSKSFICAANAKAHEQQAEMQDDENRVVWFEGNLRPIPRSERSMQIKIAQKMNAHKKRNLDELYQFPARGSLVGSAIPSTSVITEPYTRSLCS